jgi:hypothetical protein
MPWLPFARYPGGFASPTRVLAPLAGPGLVSGWILKNDKDSSKYKIAAGTTLAAGRARAFDVHGAFGLGDSDKARLYKADGSTLVDSVSWSTKSDPSWSRCPNGTGPLTSAPITLGAPDNCGTGTGPVAWPGGSSVSTADGSNVFGEDMSGLYQEGGVLWAAQNSGQLWRLVRNGSGWTPDTANGWSKGKALPYPTIRPLAERLAPSWNSPAANSALRRTSSTTSVRGSSRVSLLFGPTWAHDNQLGLKVLLTSAS